MNPRHTGLSYTTVGLIALVVTLAGTYLGFTKADPFAPPFELRAAFRSTNNIAHELPVRIAGVTVGKVMRVDRARGRRGHVTMRDRRPWAADPLRRARVRSARASSSRATSSSTSSRGRPRRPSSVTAT